MKKEAKQMLVKCGVPQHLLGCEYLCTAIELVHTNRNYLRAVTKKLYPEIAEKHSTTSTRVERAIRHAIETSFSRIHYGDMVALLGNTVDPSRGKATNAHFIAAIVEALENDETD